MSAIEGGIRMAVEADAAMTRAEKGLGQPAFIIDGSMTVATAAASAGPDPDMPSMIRHTSTATSASPPFHGQMQLQGGGIRPKSLCRHQRLLDEVAQAGLDMAGQRLDRRRGFAR
jgi:hypothetical protein